MITFNFLVFVLFLSLGFSAELVEAHTKPNSRVVLCSTSLFADLVSTICDSDCEALSLVPQGLDPHLFELRPNALRNLPTPILVVYNGGGFEPWLDSLLSTKFKMIPQLKLLSQLQLTLKPQADFSTEIDPHAWLSPQNGARYYQSIAEKLGELFPEKKVLFKNRAQQIQLALSARAGHWRKEFSEFKSKKILTSHDAFQYFAKDFGLEIVSAQGWSTNSEIKPKSLALLIGRIKAEKIRVLFLESSANSKIIEQIARSTGAVIGGTLNPDNLTPKVSSYLNLIDTNAEIIFTALKKAQEAGGSGL